LAPLCVHVLLHIEGVKALLLLPAALLARG